MLNPKIVYLDMDGVLVNFNRGAAPLFGLTYPETDAFLGYDWIIDKARISIDEFFSTLSQCHGFWENLKPMPWTYDLIRWLNAEQLNWRILTAAPHDPNGWQGKAAWVTKHLSDTVKAIHKLTMVCGTKYQTCRPGDLLIDDCVTHCSAWSQCGGHSYHWLDYTDTHPACAAQLVDVKQFIIRWRESN